MPKALKISCDTVEEIEVSNNCEFIQDEEYQSHVRSWDSHCLSRCERWKHRRFRLSMVCWDMFYPEEDEENLLATYIYRRLKHYGGRLEDLIYGPVYITNEDENGIIDFTKQDLKYILEKLYIKGDSGDPRRCNAGELPMSDRELIFYIYLIEELESKFPELMPSETNLY